MLVRLLGVRRRAGNDGRAARRIARRSAMGLAWLALLLAPTAARAADLVLANAALEIRLDGTSGALTQVTDRVHGIALVRQAGLSVPFRVGAGSGVKTGTGPVTATLDPGFPGTAYDLAWPAVGTGLSVTARVEVPAGSGPARFSARVEPGGGERVDWVEFPVSGGIGALGSDPARTELVMPFATGYRIVDPLARLPAGTRYGFYPDAYGGAALQQFSYLERDTGGFHFQVEDATAQAKNLDLWRNGSWLELAIRWYAQDVRAGAGVVSGGPFVVAASATGRWEEGADRYRAWALLQPWAAKGPRRDWPENERARWLFEQTGVTTFGISVRRDQAAWFSGLRSLLGTPLFHVSGFWWPGGTFVSEWYGGYNDWSDDRINPANFAAIRSAGDRFALFLFPQHFSRDASEYANPAPDPGVDPVAPWSPYAMVPDPESAPWSYICPATATWPAFYGWRAVTLMNRHQPDAEYLDIGPGLGRVRCEKTAHGHLPGYGTRVVDGVKAMLDSRRGDVHASRGAFVPRGTELISELYLDRFDFYQARAQAGPLTMLEGDALRAGVKAGWAEKIPLFEFVYHDYAPVRLDGNLKLATQLGALFHQVAARVVVDGGLPELNYELSSLERLPGMSGWTAFETYRPSYDCLDRTPYSASTSRADFLRALADLRTRRGPDFLAYGRMRRGPVFTAGTAPANVSLDWRLYNTFQRAFTCDTGFEAGPEYFETGTQSVASIVSGGWSAPFPPAAPGARHTPVEKVGLALVEVGGSARATTLMLDPSAQGVPLLNFRTVVQRRTSDDDRGVLQAGATLPLSLAAYETLLVRLEPAPCAGPACRYRVWRAQDPRGVFADDAAFADVTGHAWSHDALGDGTNWFYLVDDGAGFPADGLAVTKGTTVDLAW